MHTPAVSVMLPPHNKKFAMLLDAASTGRGSHYKRGRCAWPACKFREFHCRAIMCPIIEHTNYKVTKTNSKVLRNHRNTRTTLRSCLRYTFLSMQFLKATQRSRLLDRPEKYVKVKLYIPN